jgi:hypothetical protein
VGNWRILLVEEVAEWFVDLTKNDPDTADLVEDAVDRLVVDRLALGRPLVDRIHGSRHHNMKELRPGSTGSSGRGWYDTAIPLADQRYDAHLAELETRNYE